MKPLKISFALIFVFTICCLPACQPKKSKPSPELLAIDLNRGDITFCGVEQFGEVSFAFSCSEDTHETFTLAISLLHSFEYAEAEKAFVAVIDADPDCAMAYWGVAMSNFHPLWAEPSNKDLKKGSQVLKIAESLSKSAIQQEYLDAIGAFYTDWQNLDHRTRTLKFEKAMAKVYENHEEDTEAAIFYALALNAAADLSDKQYTKQRKAGKILEALFPDQPNHPGIAHYIIHNYDNPELAKLALSTARIYADIAPGSAHAQHMPSHIFIRLGLWGESISTNINSTASALCYAQNGEIDGHWGEEFHAMDYLVYAYLQQANNQKANEQLNYLKSFKHGFPMSFKIAYATAAIPARIALENKDWEAAAKLQLPSVDVPWEEYPWQKAILHFTRAFGSVHLGDILAAEQELALLEILHQELEVRGDISQENQTLIQVKITQAWIFFAQNKNSNAVLLMTEAVEMEESTTKHPVTPGEVLPAREIFADMLLAMDRPEEALESYEIDLKGHPNRFNGIYGAAIAAKNMGDEDKALAYFNTLVALTEGSSSDRKEIIEARAYINMKKNTQLSAIF